MAYATEAQFYSNDLSFSRWIYSLYRNRSEEREHCCFHRNRLGTESQASRKASTPRVKKLAQPFCQGRYFEALDAVEVSLQCRMVDDMPDAGWFLKAVGDLVASFYCDKWAEGTHSRVAACGECAPYTYGSGRKGRCGDSTRRTWNQIAEKYDVDILCGYSLESLRCEEDSYTFRRICAAHSAVRADRSGAATQALSASHR